MLHTMKIGQLVPRRRFLKGFYHIGCGSHFGHVTHMPQTNFLPPYPWRIRTIFGFDWPSGLGEEDV